MTTSAFSAYSTLLALTNGSGFLEPIAELRSITGFGLDRDMLEVTHMESSAMAKEFIAGVADGGTVELELNYLPANSTHQDMLTNLQQTTVANIFRTYRIMFPDWGNDSETVTVSSGTWTTGTTYTWITARPFIFTTTGTLPTTTPQVVPGRVYWLRKATTTTFTAYLTSADAIADANQITGGTGGSGTHTVKVGSLTTFTGAFKGARVTGAANGVLTIAASLKVTSAPTFPS